MVALFCTANFAQAQYKTITASVIKNTNRDNISLFYVTVIATDKKYIFTNGLLKIDSLRSSDSLLLFYSYMCKDTVVNLNKISSTEYPLTIALTSTCKYDWKKIEVFCDKCKSIKDVIPIKYGLMINMSFSPDIKQEEFYSGGCEVSNCQPSWYCKKCKTEF